MNVKHSRTNSDIRIFKYDGKENISSGSNIEVTLGTALREIEKLPEEGGDSYYLGFVNNKNETIQFQRFEENDWVIDVPIFEGTVVTHSLEEDGLTTETVKEVVKNSFIIRIGNLYVIYQERKHKNIT